MKKLIMNTHPRRKWPLVTLLMASSIMLDACNKNGNTTPPTPVPVGVIEQWITKGDQSMLLQKQSKMLAFGTTANTLPTIELEDALIYQSIDGFGYTLTGGSAYVINNMNAAERAKLLNEVFGNTGTGIGVSYLRLSLGASDLSPTVFSYNDLPVGETDETLSKFSLANDEAYLFPVLKEILAINPNIKLMASPWSPPVWMKDNGSSIGGSLQPKYYAVYAQYFVKYIQAMKAKGFTIDAITVQNEPQHGGNNPSMVMSAAQQADFVKNHLGPAFQAASLATKIIIWDHNCDNPNYPISILNDPAAKPFINGSAFHLYSGDISALSTVRSAHPDKALYFTEQWTGSKGSFDGDLMWHIRNVVIGSMRNWSRNALEWNLANDPSYGPHTPGGCTECKGALTVDGSNYTKNVGFYIIAHASKFVPAGSNRMGSTAPGIITHVAFKTPAGKYVIIVLNDSPAVSNFNIKHAGKWAVAQVPANSVATFVW